MISDNKLKLLILSDPDSPHTIKWISSLAERNINIFLFGLSQYDKNQYKAFSNVRVYSTGVSRTLTAKPDSSMLKLVYLKSLLKLKEIIKDFQPGILHAHYARSYGLLGALTSFHPYFISAWGSDVYDFPLKSMC